MDFSYIFYQHLDEFQKIMLAEGLVLQIGDEIIPVELKSFSLSFTDKKLQIVVINKNTNVEETYECDLTVDCYGKIINLGEFVKVE